MARITVGDQELSYERVAKNRSETVFEAVMVVESQTGELSVRRFELDVSARDDLSTDVVESAIDEWTSKHGPVTIDRLVIEESNRCAVGRPTGDGSVEGAGDSAGSRDAAVAASGRGGDGSPLYRGSVQAPTQLGFGDVDVERGEEVEFHVAGPSTSVYGTDTGTVTGIKTGTDDYLTLIIETDSGTKRVREDWIVDGDEDESEEADDSEAAEETDESDADDEADESEANDDADESETDDE